MTITSTSFFLLPWFHPLCLFATEITPLPCPQGSGQRLIRCIYLERVGFLLYSSKPALSQVHTNAGGDNSREGLHLFPHCQISKRYFPVVLLHIPLILSQLLEGSVLTCQHNVSATSLFSLFPLSSLNPRSESSVLWGRLGVYLAQDFNHYKMDSAWVHLFESDSIRQVKPHLMRVPGFWQIS